MALSSRAVPQVLKKGSLSIFKSMFLSTLEGLGVPGAFAAPFLKLAPKCLRIAFSRWKTAFWAPLAKTGKLHPLKIPWRDERISMNEVGYLDEWDYFNPSG